MALQTPAEQHGGHRRVDQRFADVRLHLPPEVHAAEDGSDVDQAMQALPAAAEPAHPAPGGCHRERYEQHERRESDRDVWPLRDVRDHLPPVECLIHEQVEQEMQCDVGECVEAQHAPERQQARPAADLSQRRHREGQHQEPQAPDPERVLDLLDRVRTERRVLPAEHARQQPAGRQQA
jgi:hypothetical protein